MDALSSNIHTAGGATIQGDVTVGRDFVGRDQLNVTMAEHGLVIIQQFLPGSDWLAQEMVEIGTENGTTVKLIREGKQSKSFLLDKRSVKETTRTQNEANSANRLQDVAILVDISQRMLLSVARYLDQQNIDADMIVISNDPNYGADKVLLDNTNPQMWTDLVQDFSATLGIINRYMGEVAFHFFLSTPLPLTFGLGCVWGTVREAMVYHYDKGTYYPVLQISRSLR